ncbi:hypothetical protein ACFFGH_19775 [Lysobacter korlensis]|uniref:Uncharacterized protein n=1 Tax=Lysobacter korlensis TaxID=553636 RepID=A0ABV6RSX3_9GAMM
MDDDEDLDAVIDRALRRASLPASDEARAGVPLHASEPPPPAGLPFDDGD